MDASTWTILAVAATATSALSAVIGMAGGIILLAIMLLFLPVELVIPIHAAVQLISNGTRVILFIRHVEWRVWAFFSVPAGMGILLGRELFAALDPDHLRYLIAVFILIATYLPKPKGNGAWPRWPFLIAGAVGGTLGMIVGAIGPIIAPFFLHTKILKEEMIATKAVCQATVPSGPAARAAGCRNLSRQAYPQARSGTPLRHPSKDRSHRNCHKAAAVWLGLATLKFRLLFAIY